jgi:hypothetical protein
MGVCMRFNEQLGAVRWKRIGLTAVAGVAIVLAISTAYDSWRRRDGWCVRYLPDGSEQTFYGTDCKK